MHRAAAALLVFIASPALGADRFVAPGGDDANPGTDAEPWLTIQHAADSAAPGDVVMVRSGVYVETVSVSVSGDETLGWITFRSEVAGGAEIRGPGLAVAGEETWMVRLSDIHHVRVEGFSISGLSTDRGDDLVGGILVENVAGTASDIEIVDCSVAGIANNGSGERNAHGIAVYGRSAAPLTNVTVEGCSLTNLTLGASEALVVNGNVDGFLIRGNFLSACDNIGIDAIGLEGTAPSDDRARNGVIRENDVFDCSTDGNPFYRGDLSAGGIYVDGGEDILIEANVVSLCDIGIEVASEAKGGTTDSGTGEILVQKATGVWFTDNLVVTTAQSLGVTNPFKAADTNAITFARNVWWSNGHPGALRFEWNRKDYQGLAAFSAANGDGGSSVVADPIIATNSGGGIDTTPFPGSPLIDSGDPAYVADPEETDAMGRGRVIGPGVDRGAFESASGVSPPGDLSFLSSTFRGVEGRPFRARIALRGGMLTAADFDTAGLPGGLVFDPIALTITGTPTGPAEFSESALLTVEDLGTFGATISIDIVGLSSADRDADQFPNGLEAEVDEAFVDDPGQTPVGAAPVELETLTLRKLQVSLRVTRTGFVDKVTLDGTLPYTSETTFPDQITVWIGGVLRKFQTSGSKKASTADAKVKLQRKDDALRVRVTIKPATDFETVNALADEGFFVSSVPKDAGVQFPISVFVLADDVASMADAVTDFVATRRKLRAKLAKPAKLPND